MVVRYKTDFYESYMLMEIPWGIDREQYSFKMLQKNKIQGILPCKERMEDGKNYLYIDISGKKNLIQEYKDKEMELEDMIQFFQQLLPVLEELKKYLLTEKMAVLEPEYIYRDMENGSLYITVLPWEREGESGLHKLAEFFLEKINHKDEYGVNSAYHFYKQQSQPLFSLYHFIPVLEKENILKRQQKKDSLIINSSSKILEKNGEDYLRDDALEKVSLPEEKEKKWEEDEKKEKNYTGILLLVLSAVIFLFAFLPIVKTKQKIVCLILSFLLMIGGVLIKGMQCIQKKRREKEDEFVNRGNTAEEKIVEIGHDIEETVFFDSDSSDELLKLQWKERGRTKQEVLRNFPCTIGKLEGETSVVIRNPSVSRVHCRLVEHDRGIAIMDLNSTNGTYLNGIRVKEGEILEIVKNDEILVGKVKVLVV